MSIDFMRNKNTIHVVANENKRLAEIRLRLKYAPQEPTKYLNVIGNRCNYNCVVTYDINKTGNSSTHITEVYEVYEHKTKQDKLFIKHQFENYNYDLPSPDSESVVFFDKKRFEYVMISKPSNFNDSNECELQQAQKSQFLHKRLNKKCELVDGEYTFGKDCYFVINAKLEL